jgi:hypothetical protein
VKKNLVYLDGENEYRSQKPFVEKYVQANAHLVGEQYEVLSVERAKSGSGYKLETSDFIVFLRINSTLLTHLLEALEVWKSSANNPALIVELSGSNPYYRLAADQSARRSWSCIEGKYIVLDSSTKESRKAGNPFLTARSPLPQTAHTELGYPGQEEEPPSRKKRSSADKEP